MQYDLPKKQNGGRVVHWPLVLIFSGIAGIGSGAGLVGAWFLITNQFSLFAAFWMVFLSLGLSVGFGVMRAMQPRAVSNVTRRR